MLQAAVPALLSFRPSKLANTSAGSPNPVPSSWLQLRRWAPLALRDNSGFICEKAAQQRTHPALLLVPELCSVGSQVCAHGLHVLHRGSQEQRSVLLLGTAGGAAGAWPDVQVPTQVALSSQS